MVRLTAGTLLKEAGASLRPCSLREARKVAKQATKSAKEHEPCKSCSPGKHDIQARLVPCNVLLALFVAVTQPRLDAIFVALASAMERFMALRLPRGTATQLQAVAAILQV